VDANVQPNTSVLAVLRTQMSVITALTLREIYRETAHFSWGFAFQLIEPAVYVAVVSGVHVYIHNLLPAEMTPLLFIVLGVVPEQTFRLTCLSIDNIIRANQQLLSLPRVTALDIVFGKGLQLLITHTLIFCLFAGGTAYYEHVGFPREPLGVYLSFVGAWWIGFSFGLILVPLNRVYPPIERLMLPIIRLIFYTSGLYFTITDVPSWAWPYLTWNPLLHVHELLRTDWYHTYKTPIGSPFYIICVCTVMTFIGLAWERYTRRMIE
jgi:capsular polysaccharide transport system permease protein